MNFKTRAFVSITLALSFIIVALSGVVLYVMPHGRVAYWINWKMMGLSKDDWDAVHTVVGFVFILTAFVHIYLNWKTFLNYLKNKLQRGIRLKKEFVLSLIITGIIVAGTIGEIPPFSSIMDIGESIKESWGTTSENSPFPHAELMTLENLIDNLGLSSEKVINNLESYGIKIETTDETLKSIAQRHNMSPRELFRIIQPHRGDGTGRGTGKGLGKGEGKGLGKGGGRGKRNSTNH